MWSWRESNPRPNRETIRFLHAYFGLHFRATARPKPPTDALVPKFHLHIGTYADYSRYSCTAEPRGFGTTSLERCLVPSPGDGIKPVIYCTSIRQRERTCFRQLNCRPNGLWSIQPSLRMLTYHLDPLSNPVNPRCIRRLYATKEILSAKVHKKLNTEHISDKKMMICFVLSSFFHIFAYH